MLDRVAASALAARSVPPGLELDDPRARELETGWFFPYRATDPDNPPIGTNGVIVNKQTGVTFHLGSAFPLERDLALYDRGYLFTSCDLIVTRIADMELTLDTLEQLELSTVEPTYEYGTVWRIPRRLTRAEIRSTLVKLPHVFGPLSLYFRAEALETANRNGAFTFEVLGCP